MGIFSTEPKAARIDKYERLSDVTKLSAHVTRILGQNPGHMTLQGTNSYLLQPPSDPLAPIILIDTSSPHTAAQYVDLVVSHLHHLGLESGVREIHFESAYAQAGLDLLNAPISGPASGSGPKGKEQDAAEAELDAKAKAAQTAEEAKQAVLKLRMDNPLVNPLERAEYGDNAPYVPAATAPRALPIIEHIILTHRHLDHTGALPLLLRALQSLGLPPPKIWKMPNPDEATLQANDKDRPTTDGALIDQLPKGLYVPFSPFQPLHPILPGLMISILDSKYRHHLKHDKDGRPKWNDVPELARVSVRCLKTPGHTADSISMIMCEGEKGVFSGDTVLGEGTTVFTDLTSYMTSLRTLAALKPATLYPGHGHAITAAPAVAAHIQQYITHRVQRESQILSLLSTLSAPHALHSALLAYFDKRNAEAIKKRKEDREFITGLPYKGEEIKGGKVKKAGYGTLKWVSEAGSDDEGEGGNGGKKKEKGKKEKEEKVRPGKYGYGKPLPDGFEEKGMLRGKDAGKEKKPDLKEDEHAESQAENKESEAEKARDSAGGENKEEEVDANGLNETKESTATLGSASNGERLILLPDLSPFDSSDSLSMPIPILARLLYDTSDEKIIYAGGKSILAHLEKLEKDGKVKRDKGGLPVIRDMEVVDEKEKEGWEVVEQE